MHACPETRQGKMRLYTYHSTNSYTPSLIDLLVSLVICHRISSLNSCMQPKERTSHRMDQRNPTTVGQSMDHGRSSFNVCGIGCMGMPPPQCLRVALPSLIREQSLPQVLAFVSRLTKWFFQVVVHPPQSLVLIQLSIPLPLLWMICALEALLIMMSTTTVELFVTYLWSSTISRNVTAVHSPLYLLQGRSQRPKDLLKTSCAQNCTTNKTSGNDVHPIVNNFSDLSLIPYGH